MSETREVLNDDSGQLRTAMAGCRSEPKLLADYPCAEAFTKLLPCFIGFQS
jgi:hypothetical protein